MSNNDENNETVHFIASRVEPLPDVTCYYALSPEQLTARHAALMDHFVSLAVDYSNRRKTSVQYLLKEVQELSKTSVNGMGDWKTSKDQEITLARKLVEVEELCGTVLDRLIAFTITNGNIENVKDKKALSLLNKWKESVGALSSSKSTTASIGKPFGLYSVFESILERLYTDGDAFITEIWEDSVSIDGDYYILPVKVNVQDTLLVEINQEEYFKNGGAEQAYLRIQNQGLPSKKDKIPLFSSEIKPVGQFTTHLKLRPKTYWPWGTSYFKRAFSPIAEKKRLEALEVSTVEGMINRITILLAGKIDSQTESGIIAPHRLAVLERLIAQPKVNNLILWPGDDLDVKDIQPDTQILTYEKKYESVNEKILSALGFPRVLIDGEGSSTENWQKFLGLISYLDKIRLGYLVPWLNRVLKNICERNGFSGETPRFSFSRLKLYDLRELLNAVKVYYDRGLMSELTALTSGDLDFEVEFRRREVENKTGILEKFNGPKGLPFSKNSPDGSSKEGNTSPNKSVSKPPLEDKDIKTRFVKAAKENEDRDSIIQLFSTYLLALHDSYTRRILLALTKKNYDGIDEIVLSYKEHFLRDVYEQMFTLFSVELAGTKVDDDLLEAAEEWITTFTENMFSDIRKELANIVSENRSSEKASLLPDLIAGYMASIANKRIRLYSSAVYNKSTVAGQITTDRRSGNENMIWQSSLSERTCEFCGSMHNKILSSSDFFRVFPPHPNCECWGVSSNEELSGDIPVKDSKNWSRKV